MFKIEIKVVFVTKAASMTVPNLGSSSHCTKEVEIMVAVAVATEATAEKY